MVYVHVFKAPSSNPLIIILSLVSLDRRVVYSMKALSMLPFELKYCKRMYQS